MPVTARLSRKLYDVLSEDVVNELVEWFNLVDATYRTDLRELNELNFGRFRAEMSQQISVLRFDLDSKWERRFTEIDSRLVRLEEGLRGEFRAELAKLRVDLVKWMFVFWATTALAVVGLTLRVS